MNSESFWYYFSLTCAGHIGFAFLYVHSHEYNPMNGLWWSLTLVLAMFLFFPEYVRSPKVSMEDSLKQKNAEETLDEKLEQPVQEIPTPLLIEEQSSFTVHVEEQAPPEPEPEPTFVVCNLCVETQESFSIVPEVVVDIDTEEIKKLQRIGELSRDGSVSSSVSPPGPVIMHGDLTVTMDMLTTTITNETMGVVTLGGTPTSNEDTVVESGSSTPINNSSFSSEEYKVNERKPMVFIGGLSASITPLELIQSCKLQGFNITVVPRIRYGMSFGFCPDLVLSSEEEMINILSMGRIWIKDRWCDVRPYVAKDTSTHISVEGGSTNMGYNPAACDPMMLPGPFSPMQEFSCSPMSPFFPVQMPFQVPGMFHGHPMMPMYVPNPEHDIPMNYHEGSFPQVQPFPQGVVLESV